MTIIEYVTANPCAQFSNIQAATGLTRSACSKLLAELKKNGALIMTGVKRGARYTLAPVVGQAPPESFTLDGAA